MEAGSLVWSEEYGNHYGRIDGRVVAVVYYLGDLHKWSAKTVQSQTYFHKNSEDAKSSLGSYCPPASTTPSPSAEKPAVGSGTGGGTAANAAVGTRKSSTTAKPRLRTGSSSKSSGGKSAKDTNSTTPAEPGTASTPGTPSKGRARGTNSRSRKP